MRMTSFRSAARALLLSAAMLTPMAAAPARTLTPPPAQAPVPASRPNIVVILVDDMGFSDIGPYGSEIPTPNLDKLAKGGLKFTQFYNTARCSTSRASVLTGLYPHQAGMGGLDNVVVPGVSGFSGKLLDRTVTLAEVLHSAGYYTGMAGKWHVGLNHGSPPWTEGFDRSLSIPGGTYFPDQRGKKEVQIDGRGVALDSPEVGKGEWYSSDLLVDWITKFAGEAKAKNQPFFAYLPFTAVHFPVMAPADEIAKFKGKYMAGWEAMRQTRFARQKALGIVDPGTTMAPLLPENYDWATLSASDRERFDLMMAVYAAAVSRMDKAVGTLVDRLRASGQLDNTLILFMADNGGNAEAGPDGRGQVQGLGGPQSNLWVGLNWATLQNTPLPYFKHYTNEGGISTPLIAYWPKGIDPKLAGTLVRAPGHLIDVMPTLVQVSGATYSKEFKGHAILPMSGRSMAPAFHGQALTRSVPIYWEHEGNKAIRDGDWKLVARNSESWALYDLAHDRGETKNLASANPQMVAKMSRQWDDWAKNNFVTPWPRGKISGGVVMGKLEGGSAAAAAEDGDGPQAGAADAPAGRKGRKGTRRRARAE